MVLIWILGATLLISLVSLVGIFTVGIKKDLFNRVLILFVGFATGALIGGAFLHLLPEALEFCGSYTVFLYTIIGFTVFFIMERYLYWRHCHEGVCDVHVFTYLNLIGDGVHNFMDGLVIAASFIADIKLGIITTLVVILHEVPQEIGDFGILVYGGLTKKKALFFNFLCALLAVLGAVLGYFISSVTDRMTVFLIAFTAGGFIYIAGSDLIPELHRQKDNKRANLSIATFILGIVFMAVMKLIN